MMSKRKTLLVTGLLLVFSTAAAAPATSMTPSFYLENILKLRQVFKEEADNLITALIDYTPPNLGTPPYDSTTGAPTSGDTALCTFDKYLLVAIALSTEELGSGYRFQDVSAEPTLEPRPVFWFHVPQSDNPIKLNVRLQQKQTKEILYQENLNFEAQDTASIVGLKLPDTAPELELDTDYQWILRVDCGEGNKPVSASITMRRVDVMLAETPLNNVMARINELASHGLLHDTLTELAVLYIDSPDEYQSTWNSLLEAVNLSALTETTQVFLYSSTEGENNN